MVSKFSTVEDFWSLFTHIKQPSEVRMGSDYSLFKEDIRPMWEDKANKEGGIWRVTLMPRQKQDLDRYWIDTVSWKFVIERESCMCTKANYDLIVILGLVSHRRSLRQLHERVRRNGEHSSEGRSHLPVDIRLSERGGRARDRTKVQSRP